MKYVLQGCIALAMWCLCAVASVAQNAAAEGSLSGVVMDPSGARVPHATVQVVNEKDASAPHVVETDRSGSFTVLLPPGSYDLIATVPGFASATEQGVQIAQGGHEQTTIKLTTAVEAQSVDVPSQNAGSTSAADNQSAMVFGQAELAELSNDNATFQQQLQALSGSDPSQPADIYINGFSGGQFPPKSSIREVRINQNPYSAEYPGYGWNRMEILTKPGGDKLHGSLFAIGNDAPFNANNPYTTVEPPYYSYFVDGTLGGPLIDKKTSFFVDLNYHKMQNNSVINAIDSQTFAPLSEAVSSPDNTEYYSLRIDRQLTTNNTFTGSYNYRRETLTNAGLGGLSIVTPTDNEGYDSANTNQTLQLSNTQIVTPKIESETKFEYVRTRAPETALDSSATLIVQGSFNGGGSSVGTEHDNRDQYEWVEDVSVEAGKHFIRSGVRYDLLREANESTAKYNGTYTFSNLAEFEAHSASQFTLTAGQPSAMLTSGTLAAYAEDEWKLPRNVTLDFGLRFESQSAIPDHADWAPRLGVAWAVGQREKKPPVVVLRAGSGIFYDRFPEADLLTSVRQNAASQQTVTVNGPFAYSPGQVETVSGLESQSAVAPIPYRVSPDLREANDTFVSIGAERSLGSKGTVTATYIWARGVHQYLSQNVNAPLPGTYILGEPDSGVRPMGGAQNIYEFTSNGIAKGKLLMFNGHEQLTKHISLFAFYLIHSEHDDYVSSTGFVSNSFDPSADFGRSTRVAHQRLFLGGNAQLPWKFHLSSYMAAGAGLPFNITTGTDLNGDTIFNDRPSFATDLTRPSVMKTKYGNFDMQPIAGQKIIPINYGNSPNYLILNADLGRSFPFGTAKMQSGPPGKQAVKGDKPYSLELGIESENVLNSVNPAPPIGVLSSPLFGKSIGLISNFTPLQAANRVVNLECSFSF